MRRSKAEFFGISSSKQISSRAKRLLVQAGRSVMCFSYVPSREYIHTQYAMHRLSTTIGYFQLLPNCCLVSTHDVLFVRCSVCAGLTWLRATCPATTSVIVRVYVWDFSWRQDPSLLTLLKILKMISCVARTKSNFVWVCRWRMIILCFIWFFSKRLQSGIEIRSVLEGNIKIFRQLLLFFASIKIKDLIIISVSSILRSFESEATDDSERLYSLHAATWSSEIEIDQDQDSQIWEVYTT